MPKVIIFDFDGTIADSIHIMLASYNQAAQHYRCAHINSSDLKEMRSMHLRDVLYFLKIPYLKLPFVLFSTLSHYKTMLNKVGVFNGIPTALCRLMVDGHKLYIVSTNSPDTIKLFLKEHEIDFFDGIYSCGSHMFGKGSIIKKLIKKESIDLKETYYVGDELRDIDAAHQVGVTSVAVGWGYNTPEKLAQQNPSVIINEPLELVDYFRSLG